MGGRGRAVVMQSIVVLSVVFAAIAVFLATYKGDFTSLSGTCPLEYTSKSSRGVTLFYDATFFTAEEEDKDEGVTRGAMPRAALEETALAESWRAHGMPGAHALGGLEAGANL